MLQENLKAFRAPVYGKIKRDAENYKVIADRCCTQITRLVEEYNAVVNNQTLLRDIRADIDSCLRRYHEFCIKGKIKSHYSEIDGEEATDFEHLIPASRLRDLLLAGVLTPAQAMNAPTVRLGKEKHLKLAEAGWGSDTPNMWLPFVRYSNIFPGEYITFDGTEIDPTTWTLEDHFRYFNV